MIVFVGADHRGYALKGQIVEFLRNLGYSVHDVGDEKLNPEDDYPQFAGRCAMQILTTSENDPRGILICGSGQGMCMSANRFKGIRASLGYDTEAATSARNDDDSNVLCLPADKVEDGSWKDIVQSFMRTPFAGAARFKRRNLEMDELG